MVSPQTDSTGMFVKELFFDGFSERVLSLPVALPLVVAIEGIFWRDAGNLNRQKGEPSFIKKAKIYFLWLWYFSKDAGFWGGCQDFTCIFSTGPHPTHCYALSLKIVFIRQMPMCRKNIPTTTRHWLCNALIIIMAGQACAPFCQNPCGLIMGYYFDVFHW